MLFHHIPKTAGSSFQKLLHNLLPPTTIFPGVSDPELRLATAEEKAAYCFFAGHYSFDVVDDNLPEATWITFLRDPLEQLVSQYYNHFDYERWDAAWTERSQRFEPDTYKSLLMVRDMTLEEYLLSENPVLVRIKENQQTRYLVRPPRYPFPRFSEEVLAEALHNLQHRYVFFGLTEQFFQSVQLFLATFGLRAWKNRGILTDNINPRKQMGRGYNLPENIVTLIRERNPMDFQLYQRAQQIFDRRFQNLVEHLMERHFEAQAAHLAWVSSIRSNEASNQHQIDIFSDSGVQGLYWPEFSEHNGRQWRWTGNGDEVIFDVTWLPRTGKSVKVSILINDVASPDVLASLSIWLNQGLPVSDTIILVEDQWLWESEFDWKYARPTAFHTLRLKSALINESETAPFPRRLGLALCSVKLQMIDE